MKYREVGKTGVVVSAIGFGGMRFTGMGPDPKPRDEAVGIVHRALELGITLFETGDLYGPAFGQSESALGEALKGWKGPVHVATKALIGNQFAGNAYQARACLEASLRRLGLDRVDFYGGWSMSGPAWETFFAKGGPLEGIRKARDEGLVGHIYGSSHDRPENVVRWLQTGEIEAVTIPYSAVKRHFRPVIDYCAEHGIGCFTMQSTHGGLLASTKGILGERLHGRAADPALAAQRWLLAHRGITAPLIGFDAVQQVESTAPLGDEADDLQAAGEHAVDFLAEFAGLAENLCSRCSYCAGCPEQIPISGILQPYQIWQIVRDDGFLADAVKHLRVAPSACTECGACEEKCPSDLPIRELLKGLSSEMARLGVGPAT